MRRLRVVVLVWLVTFCLTALVSGQVGTGHYQYGTYDNLGTDVINVGNLNLMISVPVLNKLGRAGTNFSYVLGYDSSIWTPTGGAWAPAINWGWHGDTQVMLGYLKSTSITKTCSASPEQGGPPQKYPYTQISGLSYIDSMGANHHWIGLAQFYNSSPDDSGQCQTNDGYTNKWSTDSQYYVVGDGTGNYTVYDLNGKALNTPGSPSGSGSYTDANGNQITVDNSGHFRDTTGNVVLTVSGLGTPSSSRTYTYLDTNGNPQRVVVSYVPYSVTTNFGCSGVTEFTGTSVPLVDTITLPDTSLTYHFTYESTPGASGSVTGRIASVQLPTGGIINYAYTGANNGINCADGSTLGMRRTLSSDRISPSPQRTYTRTITGNTTSHTDVSDGFTNQSHFDFVESTGNGVSTPEMFQSEYSVQTGSSGTALLATEICYNHNSSPCTTQSFSLPITSISQSRTYDGVQTALFSSTVPNGGIYAGNLLSYVYDYGASGHGTAIQRITVDYNSSGGSPLQFTSTMTEVPNASGIWTQTSSQALFFDGNATTATSGVPAHTAPPSSSPGNLTTVLSYYDADDYIRTSNQYADTGTLLSSIDSINGATTFGYDPTFIYGQSTTLPTPSSGVSMATGNQYDTAYTGLLTSIIGLNSSTQITSYDSMLRPTTIKNPDGGVETISYSPNQTGITLPMSGGTSDTEVLTDAYGRVYRTAIKANQGYYFRDTCYDQNGQVSFVSYPYSSNLALNAPPLCSGAGDIVLYDSLGRETKLTHQDGSYVSYTYKGKTTLVTDENGVQKLTSVDALGRPTAVCEVTSTTFPNSGSPVSCGTDIPSFTGYLTTYQYLPNQTVITQGVQTRTFTTDWLGRTISVQEPESGITTYGYSSNSTGLVVTRVKARANQTSSSVTTTTTTQYDRLGRVVTVTYDDGTPTKTYGYDQSPSNVPAGVSLSNVKGQLVAFATGNTQGYYGYDPLGRINISATCQPANCANAPYTTQNYVYDTAGDLMSADDGAGHTSSYTYSVASEPLTLANAGVNLVNTASYGALGLNSATYQNGLSLVNNSDSMGRLTNRWLCSGSTAQNCGNTPPLYTMSTTWSGQRVSASSDSVQGRSVNYGYDDLNRLSSQSSTSGSSANYSYSYDRWGNRLSQNATSGGTTMTTTFNTASNQISTAGSLSYMYDAAGNVMFDGVYHYTHDAEGNLTGVSGSSTATYVYDAMNHRVETTVGSVTQQFVFHPDGSRSATLSSSGAALSQQAYFNGSPLAFYQAGAFHFQHQDWIGTERMRTSANGGGEGTFTSLAFGDALTSTSGSDNDPSHYTGSDQDYETSTVHAQFRQYAANTGNWMEPDPYSGSYDLTNPQSMNRYVYVLNSPMRLSDTSGLECEYDGMAATMSDGGVGPAAVSPDPDCWASGGDGEYTLHVFYTEFTVSSFTVGYAPDPSWGVFGVVGGATNGYSRPVLAPSDLISLGKSLFSNNCNKKFAQAIPGYTKNKFFNQLANAPIQQYPNATPPDGEYGADADTAFGQPGTPIRLFPNFYGNSQNYQAFVLIHEGTHRYTGWTDAQFLTHFGPLGLQPPGGGYGTGNFTDWLQGGCKP